MTIRGVASAGEVFHNPITGERLTVLLGADDTDGRYMAATMIVPPGPRAPGEHRHPGVVEAFEVWRGELRFTLDGEERVVRAGQRVVVPAGVTHASRNAGSETAEVLLEAWPGRRFELMLRTFMGLAREGSTDASGSPDPLQLAVMAREFAPELELASPPRVLQAVVVPALAVLGRLSGRRPFYERHAEPSDRVAVAPWRERAAPA